MATAPKPEQWWVVPEGIVGDIINALTNFGASTRVHYHVVESRNRPSGIDVNGPYPNQGAAQAYANQLNSQKQELSIIQGPENAGAQALGLPAAGGGFWQSQSVWTRIGEGLAALILLDVGLKAFTGHSATETVVRKTNPAGKAIGLTKALRG